MHTPLCLSRLLRQQPRPNRKPRKNQRSSGQVLVIFGAALVTLLLFAGLAIDAGVLYVSYGQLKRSLDSAAVAAANNFKRGQNTEGMRSAAVEMLRMNNVIVTREKLKVYICDGTILDPALPGNYAPDGERDAFLLTEAPNFYSRCPTPSESPRKMVYLEAEMFTKFYFLTLIGFGGVDLHTDSTAEAAAVDLVIVIDTSESMGTGKQGDLTYSCQAGVCSPNKVDADPTIRGCNKAPWDEPAYNCTPLREAKEAAISLVETYLYDGYDQVGLVTYDTVPNMLAIDGKFLSGDMVKVVERIKNIGLHDDPPNLLRRKWMEATNWEFGAVNPVNPEDRDGDGLDYDGGLLCDDMSDGVLDGWDPTKPFIWPSTGMAGLPCDDATRLDAFDWNDNGLFDQSDHDASADWLAANGSLSVLSTCTGCGIRVGSNLLKLNGRTNSLWVMILLSDGQVNMSDTGWDLKNNIMAGDTPDGTSNVPGSMPNGYCTGTLNGSFWTTGYPCVDYDTSTRYCVDADPLTCPPYSIPIAPTHNNNLYSVEDYARDMTDEAALTISENIKELRGNDITIFSIGLNVNDRGETLLRYIANVGEDGNRDNPPACPARKSCGNYFYAVNGDDLLPIFEKIATRIYTRITN